jgi:molybdate/tungstate transport system substrate-binding protein
LKNKFRAVSTRIAAVVIVVFALGVAGAYYIYSGSISGASKQPLVFYVADAYVPEAQALVSTYAESTGVHFAQIKSGGSFALARQIAEGNPADLFLSAAQQALTSQYMGNATEGWGVAFAADQMVLAYSNLSASQPQFSQLVSYYKNAIHANSTFAWYTFFSYLTSGSFKIGISNPNDDPGGLRGWLSVELAGFEYASGNTSYFLSRIVNNKENVTGLNSAALVAPLEEGQIQLLYIYKSAAVSDNLSYFTLPLAVNLGDPSLNGLYSRVTYNTVSGLQKGQSILIFLTVVGSSPNQQESLSFVTWTIRNSDSILSKYGLDPLSTALLFNNTSVPSQLNSMIAQGYLRVAGNLN